MTVLTALGRLRGERLEEDLYRVKAARTPINGPYKEAAKLVRRLLGWEEGSTRPYLSTRNAQNKTGISNGTINTLAHGGKVSANTVEIFANRLNEDPEKLKLLFGHISPEQINRSAAESDILARIGPDIDRRPYEATPVSASLASAGLSRGPGEGGEEPAASWMPADARGIEVRGDCMEPFFHNGDIVFIRPQSGADPGQKVVALLSDDSLTCKVFRQDGGGPHLEATNGKYPRINAPDFTVLGVIVMFMREVK